MTATDVLLYPATQLFMERATGGGHGSALSDIDGLIVARICRRLDGIPLAIELAASRTASHGIGGMEALLQNRFGLLWQGRRAALPRHQTLNAMLDWSYNLLAAHEKGILCRLSVFVGDFVLQSARTVVSDLDQDDEDAVIVIDSLVAKSLVSTPTIDGSIWYRLADTTRSYALKKLEENGERDRLTRRHAEYYCELFQRAEAEFGDRPISEWLAEHKPRLDNLRAALNWAFSPEGDASIGVTLTAAAAPLFIRFSLLEECGRWCEQALAGLDVAARGTRQEIVLQESLALSFNYMGGNIDQVRVAIERGLALGETFEDRRHKLQLLFGMYRLLVRRADFRGALAVAQQSATSAKAAEDPAGLLISDFMLGTCHHFIGDQAAAQFYGERNMARAAEPGAPISNFFGFDPRVTGPLTLARALWLRGFSDRACRLVKSSFDDEPLSGVHPLTTCMALIYGLPVFLWSGDFRTADGYVARLIDYAGRHSLERFRLIGLGLKGALAVGRDELETGIELLRGALEILIAKDRNFWPLSLLMGALADGLCKSGQLDEALLIINQAMERSTDGGPTYDMAELLRIKARILADLPRYGRDLAMNCLTDALAVARAQSALALELRSTITQARSLAEGGQRDQARHDLALVYGRFTEGFETADLRTARQLMEHLG